MSLYGLLVFSAVHLLAVAMPGPGVADSMMSSAGSGSGESTSP